MRSTNHRSHDHEPRVTNHDPELRMMAWELTRSCNLACVHCRASAECGPYAGELSTEECLQGDG